MTTHLRDTSARIMDNALKENGKRLNEDYDSSLPFKILVYQVEDSVDCASARKLPSLDK